MPNNEYLPTLIYRGIETADVAVLRAGACHCRPEANQDFLFVGVYPPGQQWDICRQAPTPEVVPGMAVLVFPSRNPVNGKRRVLLNLRLK